MGEKTRESISVKHSMLPIITEDLEADQIPRLLEEWVSVDMSVAEERSQITNFIDSATVAGRGDLITEFVSTMRRYIPHEEEMPYLAYVLTLPLQDSSLDLISELFDPEYFEIVSGLLFSDNEGQVMIAVANMSYIFRDLALDVQALEHLHHKAGEKSIPSLTEYLAIQLEEARREYAVVPEWIIPGSIPHASLVSRLRIRVPVPWISNSVEEDAAYLTSLVEEDRDLLDVERQLIAKLSDFTKYDREAMITQLRLQNSLLLLALDPDIFRVLGACHPLSGAYQLHAESRDPCCMYGGCRVYSCYENENINKDTEEPLFEHPVSGDKLSQLEWFTGRCSNENCKLFIRKKHYALRVPHFEGGWLGCYCSFFCMRYSYQGNETVTRLINGFEGQYLEHGIYDR